MVMLRLFTTTQRSHKHDKNISDTVAREILLYSVIKQR
jgi:hypothetical protein